MWHCSILYIVTYLQQYVNISYKWYKTIDKVYNICYNIFVKLGIGESRNQINEPEQFEPSLMSFHTGWDPDTESMNHETSLP